MGMIFERKLTIPKEAKEMYPLSESVKKIFEERSKEIADVFSGKDNRLAVIIGPCSADRNDSVLDYISRLREIQEEIKDKVLIIPRIYTNKPRTTGAGYKGMLHQPNPEEKPDMFKGIVAIRKLHMQAVEETGFLCADEMLYPENYRYLDDLLGYTAIGARSVEDQQHRLTASGVSIPVGMKNPTSGDYSVMMNSILAAQNRHTFIYRGWEVHSEGNPLAHAILRGYVNEHGQSRPNYHYEDLVRLVERYNEMGLVNPGIIVDTNHSNSGKNPFEQPRIVKEVINSCQHNPEIKRMFKGFMIESYIEDGAQKIGEGVYGKSITDACIGWPKTVRLLYDIADAL